jgi:phage baseplate assembly protein W
VGVSSYEEDIKEAIHIILGTAKGERLMRPDFGCGIHEYVFCSMNTLNLHMIENTIFEALIRWEPRIDVTDVKAKPEAEDGKLIIEIDYQIRSTNTRFNLVYPFYLKEG